jgi:hypothetical protein
MQSNGSHTLRGDARVVRDHDDCLAGSVQRAEERHDLGASMTIESAGWFIGKDD